MISQSSASCAGSHFGGGVGADFGGVFGIAIRIPAFGRDDEEDTPLAETGASAEMATHRGLEENGEDGDDGVFTVMVYKVQPPSGLKWRVNT